MEVCFNGISSAILRQPSEPPVIDSEKIIIPWQIDISNNKYKILELNGMYGIKIIFVIQQTIRVKSHKNSSKIIIIFLVHKIVCTRRVEDLTKYIYSSEVFAIVVKLLKNSNYTFCWKHFTCK